MTPNVEHHHNLFPLPLTAFEQLMLADDTASYPMTFFIEIGVTGNLQREAFETACGMAVRRHPLLAANVRWRFLKPRWVPADSSTTVDWCETSLPIPSHNNRYIDLRKQPGLRISVEHSTSESKILFQFHHATTDGIGAVQFIGDVLAEYGVSTTAQNEERPQVAPINMNCLQHRGAPWEAGRQPARLLRRWIYRVVQVLGVHPSCLFRRTNVSKEQTSDRPLFLTRSLERPELKALNQTAAQHGVTSNELLTLAMFQSVYAWNQHAGRDASKDAFRIVIPATVRTPVHDESPAANILSYILLTQRGKQIEDPETLLNFIASESREGLNGRETGFVLLSLQCVCWFPGLLRMLMRLPVRLATTVLANVGDVKRQLRNRFPVRRGKCVAGNVQLDYLLGAAPVRPGTHVATSVGKYAGRLIINLNCDSQFFTANEADEFADCFMHHVRQFCPSDETSIESKCDNAVTESEPV